MASQMLQQAAPGFKYVVVDTPTGANLMQIRNESTIGDSVTSGSSKGHGKKGQKGLKGQKGQQKGSTSKAAAKKGGEVGTGPPPQKLMGSVSLDPATFGGPGSLNKAKDLHSNEQIAGFREKQEDSVELQGHGQSCALPRPTVVPGPTSGPQQPQQQQRQPKSCPHPTRPTW